ncbi:MAG: hypothetical protein M1817_000102 [Caeruleum heppii]|nr:MAG: hypothetical protein M1817_000102 [Caeruleum heppii]
MVERRKLSARTRSSVISKKPSPSPPPPSTSSASESVAEGLPTSVEDGQPLPALDEPQDDVLSVDEYQSYQESGVIAASLQRSKSKWLTVGFFERYWTKPTKKKNQTEIKNPAKDSMVRLGSCNLIIQPHVFEVTLFGVRESPSSSMSGSAGHFAQRPIIQYGPPPTVGSPLAQGSGNWPPPAPHSQSSSPFVPEPTPQPALHHQPQSAPHSSSSVSHGGPADSSPSHASKPSPDPVIQMLATRAAADHHLKSLMRVVASGKATPDQLKTFQGHIDELTAVLQAQTKPVRPLAPSPAPVVASQPPTDGSGSHSKNQTPIPINASLAPASRAGSFSATPSPNPYATMKPSGPNLKHENTTYGQPSPFAQQPLLRAKAPSAASRSDITAVVFEFAAAPGDRFLFPKYSILEYLPGGIQVIASFIVVQKGSNSESGAYDPKLDYYQPVTMRLTAANARVLEPLARAVAPPDDVRKYMNEIMDHVTCAEHVYLAMRLPRNDEEEDEEEEWQREQVDAEAVRKAAFMPPGSIMPPLPKSQRSGSHSPDRSSSEPWASPGPNSDGKRGRTRRGRHAAPNKSCHMCHTSDTSLWRKAEIDDDNVTVCNACGIKWKNMTGRPPRMVTSGSSVKKIKPTSQTSMAGSHRSSLATPLPLGQHTFSTKGGPQALVSGAGG